MPNQRAPGVRMRCVPLHDDLWEAAQAKAKKARDAGEGETVSAVIRAALEDYTRHICPPCAAGNHHGCSEPGACQCTINPDTGEDERA